MYDGSWTKSGVKTQLMYLTNIKLCYYSKNKMNTCFLIKRIGSLVHAI